MKTNHNIRQYFPVVFLSFAFVASSFNAEEQNRRDSNRGRNHSKTEYRNSNKKENRHETAERYQKATKNYDRDGRNYTRNETRRFADRHERLAYYNHPRYGRVYHHFDHNPVVLRHDRDNYYFYGNHFYRYRPGIGYVAIAFPRNMYFAKLPYACERSYVNGIPYYRYGNLYFRLFPQGYLVVPSPFEFSITARF